jgi:hypothetical protein
MVVVLVVAVVVVVVVVVVRAVVPPVFSSRRAITFRAGFFVSSDFIRCRRTSGLVLQGKARLMIQRTGSEPVGKEPLGKNAKGGSIILQCMCLQFVHGLG